MLPGPDAQRIKTQLLVWWVIWWAILSGLVLVYYFLGRGPLPSVAPGANPLANLIGFAPLFVSIVIRWLMLPRASGPARAFVLFIMGVALAESCGLLGIFLGGPYREDLFVLGVLGIGQFVPLNARKFYEPKPPGFYPTH